MEPKQFAHRCFEEIWNRKDLAAFTKMIYDYAEAHTERGILIGPDNLGHQWPPLTV